MVEIAIVLIIIVLGFSIRGLLGYGFSAVVFPLLLFCKFDQPELLTVSFELLISILFGIKYFQKDKILILGKLFLFSVLGGILGLVIRSIGISQSFMYLFPIVVTIILLLLTKFAPKEVLKKINNVVLLGGLSGLMANWSGIAGPPIVIYTLSNQKEYMDIKSLLSMYFMCLYCFTFITVSIQYGSDFWNMDKLSLILSGYILILILKWVYSLSSKQLDEKLSNRTEQVKEFSFYFLLVICLIPILKYVL